MFRFSKKSKVCAPLTGKLISLADVKDDVFSSFMMGDGVAIEPTGDIVVAPCDCEVKLLMEKTNHAVGLQIENGAEILIHVGLDTVNLQGEGFEVFVKEGEKLKIGTPILKFDRELIKSKGYALTTMIIVTEENGNKIKKKYEGINTKAGDTPIIEF